MIIISDFQVRSETDAFCGRRTILSDLEKNNKKVKVTDIDRHPMFILVQLLEKGQYFVSTV